jgi:hypothetical protein
MGPFLLTFLCIAGVAVFSLLSIRRLAAQSANPQNIDLQNLPIGDGMVSDEPQAGYIWACRTAFNGGGAFAEGPWIHDDGTWDRTTKVTVDGEVEWANYVFTIQTVGDHRLITGNGLPNHPTGIYPIQASDDAYQYDRNPNAITEQALTFELPLNPTLAAAPSCADGTVGIMLTGIPIFNGFDAEGRDAVAHEIQDLCGGHPEITGQYHYHDLSPCIEAMEDGTEHSPLVGYAFDGFGIYGFRGEDGLIVTNADLDECHGHTHEVEWEGQMVEMYHYHATAEFPYSIGCFRGTPIQFIPQGGMQGSGQPGQGSGQQPGQGGGQQPTPGGQQPGQGGNPPPPGGNPPPPPPGG